MIRRAYKILYFKGLKVRVMSLIIIYELWAKILQDKILRGRSGLKQLAKLVVCLIN
jgi:hypothetical protein